ncbi:HNH endonuclease [Demequina litorisediminis]|nr:DUF222 domain-containing protein [Demequina litorisediminis]
MPASLASWQERVLAVLGSGHEVRSTHVPQMADADLIALGTAAGAVRRGIDRMLAVVAAEQATRSRSAVGRSGAGLARRQGRGDERGLVAGQTGGSAAEAGRLIDMGEALAAADAAVDGTHVGGRVGPEERVGRQGGAGHDGGMVPDGGVASEGDAAPEGGMDAPSPGDEAVARPLVFPHVAAAVREGRLGVEAATAITRMLSRVASRCADEERSRSEQDLVVAATHMRLERLHQLINRHEARLDAAHLEELAEARRARRFLRLGENADGMIRLTGQLDPENGAPLVAAMEAMVNQNFRARKRAQDAVKAGHTVTVDDRTPEQVRADAIGAFARHINGCDVEVLPRAGVTVVVRMDYNDLASLAEAPATGGSRGLRGSRGLGGPRGLRGTRGAYGPRGGVQVDGLSTAPSAGELRRLLARAQIIPQVLGDRSDVLDQGRRRRHFTEAQKTALVARDGGCAMCGAPPSWCDAHHIEHWARGGASDLANGVLLCVRCHHDLHRDGWFVDASATEVWFTPPASIDPARRRRPGGRRLFDSLAFGDEALGGPPQSSDDAMPCLARRAPSVSCPVPAESRTTAADTEPVAAVARGREKAASATAPVSGAVPAGEAEMGPAEQHLAAWRAECRPTPRRYGVHLVAFGSHCRLRPDRARAASHSRRGPPDITMRRRSATGVSETA